MSSDKTNAWAYRTDWDVVVIGGGPAGSVTAFALARAGRRVLVVERAQFPRDKVCGGCLNQRALAALDGLGLAQAVSRLHGVELSAFHVRGFDQAARVALPAGLALSRRSLDQALRDEAMAAGATIVHGWTATMGALRNDRRSVIVELPGHCVALNAKVCIMASGLAAPRWQDDAGDPPESSIDGRSYIGAGALLDERNVAIETGTIHMAVGRHGYVGVTTVEAGRINIAAAISAAKVKLAGGPAAACAHIMEEADMPVPNTLHTAKWQGTPPLSRRVNPLAGPRFLIVGDAGGYIEPFTGEGMAWAMTAGAAAANLVHTCAENWTREAESNWATWHAQNVAGPQRRCRLIAKALRSPFVARAALRAMRAFPALARPVLDHINAPVEAHRESMRWA